MISSSSFLPILTDLVEFAIKWGKSRQRPRHYSKLANGPGPYTLAHCCVADLTSRSMIRSDGINQSKITSSWASREHSIPRSVSLIKQREWTAIKCLIPFCVLNFVHKHLHSYYLYAILFFVILLSIARWRSIPSVLSDNTVIHWGV